MIRRRSLRSAVLVVARLALGPAVTGAAAALLEPLVVGWEDIFKLDWQAEPHGGRPVVSGHIMNDSGYPVTRVQLLVEALDDRGAVVRQTVDWLPGGGLEPAARAYFEVPAPGSASAYRVRVFAFDRIESPSGENVPRR